MRWFLMAALICSAGSMYAVSNPPSPTPTESSNPPQARASQTEQKTTHEERGSDKLPIAVKLLNTGKSAEEAKQEAEAEHGKASREGWLVVLTGVAALATVLLTIITGSLAKYTYKLWEATVKLGDDATTTAKRQAQEMQDSLAIASQAANAAERGAKVSEIALVITQRAYVHNESYKVILVRDEEQKIKEWHFGTNWENVGHTPAVHLKIGSSLMIGSPPQKEFDLLPPVTETSLGPKHRVLSLASPTLTHEQAKDVASGKTEVYLCSLAVYNDTFGAVPVRHTRICMKLGVDKPVPGSHEDFSFVPYEKYNNAS